MIKMGSTWVRKMQAEQWQRAGKWDMKQLEHTIKKSIALYVNCKKIKSK